MKQTYLLVDDHGTRADQFRRYISNDDLIVMTLFEAKDLAASKDDLIVLDGAIVDFHLETPKRPGYPFLRYPCTIADCPDLTEDDDTSAADIEQARAEHDWHITAGIPEVEVTTGLGAMLYIKQHAHTVPLYGFCELSADHSLLFLAAAQLWLGASAINAEYAPEDIRRALAGGDPEGYLPIHRQLMAAAEGFRLLTDSLDFLTRPAEALDWLDAYRRCGHRNTLAEFRRQLAERFGVRTLESDIYIEMMCRWQGALARILKAFNKDVSGWPDLRDVRSAKHWDAHNPILDFVQEEDYRTFFTAPDRRAALAYYRAAERRQVNEDPFGGY